MRFLSVNYRRVTAGILMPAMMLSCRTWIGQATTQDSVTTLAANGQRVEISTTDGKTIVMSDVYAARDSLVGLSLDKPPQRLAVSKSDVKSVQRLELAYPRWEKTLGYSYLTVVGVLGVALLVLVVLYASTSHR